MARQILQVCIWRIKNMSKQNCALMVAVALSTRAPEWKHAVYPSVGLVCLFTDGQILSTDERISKMQSYLQNGILFSHKRNEVLIHFTTHINLESILLSERSQTQKDTYYLTPLTENVLNGQMNRNRKQILGQREGIRSDC